MNAIEINNLSFGYEKSKSILSNLSLKIKENTITTILGKNGSGKSTLLDCIIGYNNYKNGSVFLFGKDSIKISDMERARIVSYIPQSTISNMDYSVLEFIAFGRNCHLKLGESLKESDIEIVKYNAEKLDIAKLLNKSINRISGGERQLAFIARALTQESPLIIMDEPTANLDFGNQTKLFTIIKELQEKGKTIVFTTHNPNNAIELDCDVIALSNGNILSQGKAVDMIDIELIKKIYGNELNVVKSLSYMVK